ncbi:MFS transporter [Nonomuraea wenchangensis]
MGRRVVTALAVTQTTGYGVLYYAFPVFLVPMAHDLHAINAQVAAVLTVSVLTASVLTASVLITAVCAPPAGRWLDAHGGRALMTLGSLLGAGAVLAWSQVTAPWQLHLVFATIGIACSMVLYEAAFAVIIAWYGADARGRARGILALTIVAGFASSIFTPLTGLLVDAYGWRQALVVLGLVYGLAAIPLHAPVIRRPAHARTLEAAGERADLVRAAVRRRPFWLLVTAFTASGGAVAVIAVVLVTSLIHLGHSPVLAATLAGLLGVLSVTGGWSPPVCRPVCPPLSSPPRSIRCKASRRCSCRSSERASRARSAASCSSGSASASAPSRCHTCSCSGTAPPPTPPCRAASRSSPSPTRPWLRSVRSPSPRPSATPG